MPPKRRTALNLLGIQHKRRLQKGQHHFWHWANFARFIVHDFDLGHRQAGTNFEGSEQHVGQQSHARVACRRLPINRRSEHRTGLYKLDTKPGYCK